MFPENSIERIVEEVSRALAGHEEALRGLDDAIPLEKIVDSLKPLLPYLPKPGQGGIFLGQVKFSKGPPIKYFWLGTDGKFLETWVNLEHRVREEPVSLKAVASLLGLPKILEAIKEATDFQLKQKREARTLLTEIQSRSEKLLGPEGEVKLT